MGKDTGYGAVLLKSEDEIVSSTNGKMNEDATAFQAECVAMMYGAKLAQDEELDDVTVHLLARDTLYEIKFSNIVPHTV